MNRRTFLKGSLGAAGAAFVVSHAGHPVLGANERVRVGVAGLNSRGGAHVSAYAGMSDAEVAYLIDPDTRTFGKYMKSLGAKGAPPQCVQDIRKALEDKDLDAVSIATCNHWHCLITIWAC